MKTGNWMHLVAFCGSLDGTWENTSLSGVMRYMFFQTPGSRPASTWMQMRWAKFTSTPLVGLKFKGWVAKVGFLRRWHLWLLWWFRMLRVVDTLWTSRNLNPIWLCDGHHYIIVNTQTNNVYTPSFLATDLKHLILYFEFTIFWTKCFGFLSFSATFWHQLQPQPGVFSMFL